ncbi:MAG: ATP-binding protein [Planctomycetota bacterium]
MIRSKHQIINRLSNLSDNHSFFLFGARGTGKTTLLKQLPFLKDSLYIDLLEYDVEEKYTLNPGLILEQARALPEQSWIIIDEIQKIPKLLDHVHKAIEETGVIFALTGSSSRKLKRGGANLLAGRAFSFSLHPFTSFELQDKFDMTNTLNWGTLPEVIFLKSDQAKSRYLRTYTQTYLKEEIVAEQLIRNLDPFRLFLPIAAQMNTQIINFTNIARDTGVDYKTIQNYYQILVDTNLGFFLEPYGKSVRRVQKQSSKFYLFDMGVKKALQRTLTIPLLPQTTEYGDAFESWFINECMRLNQYEEKDYEFSYLRTKDDAEIDLIIDRPGQKQVLVEIKSSTAINERHIKGISGFKNDFPEAEFICACQVDQPQMIKGIKVCHWSEALKIIGFEEPA